MAYVYRGAVHDLDEPVILEPVEGFDTSRCGTVAAYKRHRKYGVPACRPCLDAKRDQSRLEYAARRGVRPAAVFDPSACGTNAGYRRHKHHGVPVCAACKVANADYMRDYRQRRAA